MKNTSHNIFLNAFAVFVILISIVTASASEIEAVDSMSKRLASSAAYGIGVVRWGAIAQNVNGRAQLFTYQIEYGIDRNLRVCTERELYPGQKVFFAIKVGSTPRNESCASNAHYLPANQFIQFIYAGFDDLIGGKTWFEIPSEIIEKFDCRKIDTVRTSIEVHDENGQKKSDIRGVPGAGTYFSEASLMQCLKLHGLQQYKIQAL